MSAELIIGSIILFGIVFALLYFLPFKDTILGKDRGKKFVQGSNVNVGKPTGVGIYFVSAFLIFSAIFCTHKLGILLLIVTMILEMLSGYFDDISAKPWGEYVKAFLDFMISVIAAFILVNCFDTNTLLVLTQHEFTLNKSLFFVLALILMIVSINATNATDGVDGLSGTLSILSILTFMSIAAIQGTLTQDGIVLGVFFAVSVFVYLLFNHYPSKMLMGDAGSRSIGMFIAIYAILLKIPFIYLIVGLPFLLDGGISILKITIGRVSNLIFHKKVIILKKIRTPLHDHLKKELKFSALKTMLILSGSALIVDVALIIILRLITQ